MTTKDHEHEHEPEPEYILITSGRWNFDSPYLKKTKTNILDCISRKHPAKELFKFEREISSLETTFIYGYNDVGFQTTCPFNLLGYYNIMQAEYGIFSCKINDSIFNDMVNFILKYYTGYSFIDAIDITLLFMNIGKSGKDGDGGGANVIIFKMRIINELFFTGSFAVYDICVSLNVLKYLMEYLYINDYFDHESFMILERLGKTLGNGLEYNNNFIEAVINHVKLYKNLELRWIWIKTVILFCLRK